MKVVEIRKTSFVYVQSTRKFAIFKVGKNKKLTMLKSLFFVNDDELAKMLYFQNSYIDLDLY